MILRSVFLVVFAFIEKPFCHPQRCYPHGDYICAMALYSGQYDNCSQVIQESPDWWGVCEINTYQDLDAINIYKGLSSAERSLVCIEFQVISKTDLTLNMKCISYDSILW